MGATRTITSGLGLVSALVLSACGTQVAGAGQPPVLRIGSTNVSQVGAAMDAARPAAAGIAKSGSSTNPDPYPLHGSLPTGPASAPVYRYADAQVAEARVTSLAAVLGISGAADRHAHGWKVSSMAGTLLVRDGSGQWSFSRTDNQCPMYTVDVDSANGAVSGVGCAVSSGVAVPATDNVAPLPFADCPAGSTTPCNDVVVTPCLTDKGCLCPDGGSACSETTNGGGAPASCPATASCTVTSWRGPANGPDATPQPCVSGDPQPGVVSCSDPAPTTTPQPRPSAPAITDATALEKAKTVLAALGLGDATPQVISTGGWSDVTVDPTVGGLPTVGTTTRVSVDATGVLGATGWLGEASEGATYPLITATQALDRLRSLPVPEIAIACVQAAGCPNGIMIRPVTGATLGLALRWDGSGTVGSEVLVPSWFFSIEGSTEPLPWVAVQDAYLGDPTPDPGVTDPGSGSSASPGNPGTSESPPTPVEPPATAAPAPGGTTPNHLVAITSVTLGKDGSTLVVTGFGGVCEDYSANADESSTSIRLSLVGTPKQDSGKACPAIAKEVTATVVLASPWDKRQLVDAVTGQPVALG